MKKIKPARNMPGAKIALLVATWTLAVNFWAWSLISPLAVQFANDLALSPIEISLLLAVPVLIGSLGRIPVGILADKFGGRTIFMGLCLLASVPVVLLALLDSYNGLVAAATLLGVAGTTFVVGIPYLSAWFPPQRRGFVLGVYAIGNAGTAISGLTTPGLVSWIGRENAFICVAGMLLLTTYVIFKWGREAPGWQPSKGSMAKRFIAAGRSRLTWDLSLIYILTFGAFVAFGIYLPVLLKVIYDLSLADAAARGAGFVIVATLARPVGGWLSDKIGSKNIVRLSLLAVAILAAFVAYQPTLHVFTTIGYLSLAFSLGCGNGAVFAMIGRMAKPDSIGSVTGIVGAMGGLGGFVPPLILGLTYSRTNSYTPALIMLSASAVAVLVYINWRFANNYKVVV